MVSALLTFCWWFSLGDVLQLLLSLADVPLLLLLLLALAGASGCGGVAGSPWGTCWWWLHGPQSTLPGCTQCWTGGGGGGGGGERLGGTNRAQGLG